MAGDCRGTTVELWRWGDRNGGSGAGAAGGAAEPWGISWWTNESGGEREWWLDAYANCDDDAASKSVICSGGSGGACSYCDGDNCAATNGDDGSNRYAFADDGADSYSVPDTTAVA